MNHLHHDVKKTTFCDISLPKHNLIKLASEKKIKHQSKIESFSLQTVKITDIIIASTQIVVHGCRQGILHPAVEYLVILLVCTVISFDIPFYFSFKSLPWIPICFYDLPYSFLTVNLFLHLSSVTERWFASLWFIYALCATVTSCYSHSSPVLKKQAHAQ